MRERVLASLAAGLALGCADRSVNDVENAGGSSGGEGGTTSSTSTSTSTSTSGGSPTVTTTPPQTSSDDGSDGPSPIYDVYSVDTDEIPPLPPEECADPGGEAFPCNYEGEPDTSLHYRCMPLPPDGDCSAIDPSTAIDEGNACLGGPLIDGCVAWAFREVACAADPSVTDACCNWLVYGPSGGICPGRPFTVEGRERLASARPRESWARPLCLDVAALTHHEREALAEAWTECALFEHASVASFARFVLQLLAAGAPAELVAGAEQAMREELEHASAFFGLASAYAGAPIGPGPLRVDGALHDADDLAAVAAAAASEGCIAETISALHVAIAASHARDPVLADLLHRVAEEELRHAELAWTFVGWALHHGPPLVRTAVAAVFASPARSIPRAAALDAALPADLYLAHGLLPAEHRLPLTEHALTEIILPAAAHLRTNAEKRGERSEMTSISRISPHLAAKTPT